jgi:hypothetical protein
MKKEHEKRQTKSKKAQIATHFDSLQFQGNYKTKRNGTRKHPHNATPYRAEIRKGMYEQDVKELMET